MTGRRSAPSLPGYAAPTGLKFLWRWRCYKYAAPTALKLRSRGREKTSETVSQKIFDELPVPGNRRQN
jgi:hypothetical protein